MKVSVIILTWNGKRFLDECLGSLAQQSFRDFETILVDNGSQDDSAAYVRKRYPWVKVLELAKNVGFAEGNNRGLLESSGQYVITLNNDTKVAERFVEALVKGAESDGSIGMVAAKMLNYHQPRLIDAVGLKVATNGLGYNVGVGEQDAGQYDTPQPVFGPCGGAALYRREMINKVGFFDADFFAYYEDFDLAWRGRLAGWQSITAPEAVVYHVHSATSGEWSPFKVYYVHRNKWFNLIKNWPLAVLLKSLPRLLLYDLTSFFLSVMKGRGGAALRARMHLLRSLPTLLRKRRAVQKLRQIPVREAAALFSPAEWVFRTFRRKMARG
jgi:GT2 family glycosyltransferase